MTKKIENDNRISSYNKRKITAYLKQQINWNLGFLILWIEKDKYDIFDDQCQHILIENLEYVKF
jgi:hypothetical protein